MSKGTDIEKAYALIIGISEYKDPGIRRLNYTHADAEGFFKLLTDPKNLGLSKDNIKILLDRDATLFNIKDAISNWLYKNAEKDSVVFIFFAGYGGVEEDPRGIEKDNLAKYLLPFDSVLDNLQDSVPRDAMKLARGKQEPILRGDITKEFVISVDREHFEKIEKGRVLEEKLGILQNFYDDGKFSGKQYEYLREILKINPSSFIGDDLPVESVSWDDVQIFIKKLDENDGGNKYRLPTEAEWEYAARAGTTTSYSFGEDESKLGDYAWYYANSNRKTHPIGQKKPNSWGLYDMHGNVWEWVQDTWHDDYNGAPTDGSSWESKSVSDHVIRGGSYFGYEGRYRSAVRKKCEGTGLRSRINYLGFRLIRDL